MRDQFSPSTVPRDATEVIKFDSRCLYLLSHFVVFLVCSLFFVFVFETRLSNVSKLRVHCGDKAGLELTDIIASLKSFCLKVYFYEYFACVYECAPCTGPGVHSIGFRQL